MKIAVAAANGRVGRLIVDEALARGMDVTAIVKGENKTSAEKSLKKDILDLTKEDLKGFDAVVDAAGAWTPETVHIIPDAARHLADILKGTKTRLIVVGGAGSLYVNPEHTKTVMDTVPFPEAAMPVLRAHKKALEELRATDGTDWTYISPAVDFEADGKKTGEYLLGGDEEVLNSKGESKISYADYAAALVDELQSGNHLRGRISVTGK